MLKAKIINPIFIQLLFVFIILRPVRVYVYIFFFLIWLTLTIIGSFHIRWNYFLNALNSNPNFNKNAVAITFDDGPHPIITPQILELLEKYNAKASFFCIGKQIEEHPELFKQIVEAGHIIGNHSYSHSNNFGFFSTKNVLEELKKTDDLIYGLTNKKVKLFRPPFGVTNPNISKVIKKTKHHVIGWNIRSLDTKIKDPKKIVERVIKNLKSGDVILLHDTNKRTVLVLEQLLLFLQEKQLETVTVEQLFGLDVFH